MFKLIFAILYFIISISYFVVIIRKYGKNKDLKLIMLIIAGLIFLANGIYWLLELL